MRIPRRAALAALAILGGVPEGARAHGAGHPGPGAAIPMETAVAAERLVMPDIEVVDSHARRAGFVTRYADAGPVLISFFYTSCVELCSMVLAVLGAVDEEMRAPDGPPLRLVAVSVDPVRDTPEVLAARAAELGASARWDWVAASPADTPALLSALGLPPGPVEAHPALFLLGDMRAGRFRRIEGIPDPVALVDMARALENPAP